MDNLSFSGKTLVRKLQLIACGVDEDWLVAIDFAGEDALGEVIDYLALDDTLHGASTEQRVVAERSNQALRCGGVVERDAVLG